MQPKGLPTTVALRIVATLVAGGAGCAVANPALAQQDDLRPAVAPADASALGGFMITTPNVPTPPDTTPAPAPTLPAGQPNYGKPKPPRDPRLAYPGRRKAPAHPLPALAATPAPSVARARRSLPPPSALDAPPAPGIAVLPQPVRKVRPKPEADPFAPVGIGVGNLRLLPYIEQDVGYDTNPNRSTAAPRGSTFLRTEAGVALKSDWSVHELKGDLKAGYTDVLRVPMASRPDAQGKLDLRLDATRDTALDFELRGLLDTQRPGSTELSSTTVKSRPIVATFGGTAGGTQRFGDLSLGLHGTVDRSVYEDATQLDGTRLRLSANNYTDYGVQTRAAFQINPALAPFVELGADARKRDEPIDALGFARNSSGASVKLGTTFELSRLLTGQAAIGYASRSYVDKRLPILAAPTFDASLVWAATALTTVTLRGSTTLNETVVANAAGAVTHAAALDVSHVLMRDLTLGATATVSVNDYKGLALRETAWTGTLKADYNLSRSLIARASFTHERLFSTALNADYSANVFLIGLKLQR